MKRRTQQERRESTIAKLVDATIQSIEEVGYARTSLQQICKRAGVSHGGVFRHFATLTELVVAAADEVARRQLAAFAERVEQLGPAATPDDALRLLRGACRAPMNVVWYELIVAARTDPALKAALVPAIARNGDGIRRLAAALPDASRLSPTILEAIILLSVHVFDGEALIASVAPDRVRDGVVMALMSTVVSNLLAGARQGPRTARAVSAPKAKA
jgi:AcrR family transcriptional regulator